MTFGEVVKSISALGTEVKGLRDSVSTLKETINKALVYLSIIVAAGIGIIAIIATLK